MSTKKLAKAFYLNEKSPNVKASPGLLNLSQMKQYEFTKGYFISGVTTNGITILTPLCMSRIATSFHNLDNFKTIPFRCFNDRSEAFVVGFRVDVNKMVQPLCLEFDDTTKCNPTGICILKTSTYDWVENFRKSSDREHLTVTQAISERYLQDILTFLTTENNGGIIRGK